MAIEFGASPSNLIEKSELAAWAKIPTPIIGDELNRTGLLASRIRPLSPNFSCTGQALTVDCMVGDNSALHFALREIWDGAIIIADGRAHTETAIWGEILHTCAIHQGANGVIVDGAMRDSDVLRESQLPAYCAGISPRGPHKGFGGSINKLIQCGGVPVTPGDLVVADQDGVAIIRPDQIDGLMDRCQKRIDAEAKTLKRIAAGELTINILNFPPAESIGG